MKPVDTIQTFDIIRASEHRPLRAEDIRSLLWNAFRQSEWEVRERTSGASIAGRVIEIGDMEALDGKAGILIETTREQLSACGRNLAYADVVVTFAGLLASAPLACSPNESPTQVADGDGGTLRTGAGDMATDAEAIDGRLRCRSLRVATARRAT